MGGKSVRKGKQFCVCLALLILSGCSLLQDWREQRQIHASMLQGQNLFLQGDYEAASKKYREAIASAGLQAPADAASYNIGLIYAHPNNPKRDNLRAIESFRQVISHYPDSPWVERESG